MTEAVMEMMTFREDTGYWGLWAGAKFYVCNENLHIDCMCRSVIEAAANDAYGKRGTLSHPHAPLLLLLLLFLFIHLPLFLFSLCTSFPSSVNEHAQLYLEGADVTSGLSDESITVGVALCDSPANSLPLRRQTRTRLTLSNKK